MAELADAQASGACGRKVVKVQILSSAPTFAHACQRSVSFGWQARRRLSAGALAKADLYFPTFAHACQRGRELRLASHAKADLPLQSVDTRVSRILPSIALSTDERSPSRVPLTAVAAIFVLQLLLLLTGINRDYQLKHEDNNALHATFARSHLRLGLAITRGQN